MTQIRPMRVIPGRVAGIMSKVAFLVQPELINWKDINLELICSHLCHRLEQVCSRMKPTNRK